MGTGDLFVLSSVFCAGANVCYLFILMFFCFIGCVFHPSSNTSNLLKGVSRRTLLDVSDQLPPEEGKPLKCANFLYSYYYLVIISTILVVIAAACTGIFGLDYFDLSIDMGYRQFRPSNHPSTINNDMSSSVNKMSAGNVRPMGVALPTISGAIPTPVPTPTPGAPTPGTPTPGTPTPAVPCIDDPTRQLLAAGFTCTAAIAQVPGATTAAKCDYDVSAVRYTAVCHPPLFC